MPQADGKTLKSRLPISIPRWLRSIRNAEYLITDSFHGCVFAIIFNIPFICLGNKSRGTARFQSLLRTFNLEDRLLVNPDTDTVIRALQMPIHWEDVNRIHELERQRGISFLKRHLVQ
jgi:exopolysaccharide biosynthesis predicted pyruvyltransferase EpsI